MGPPLSTGMFPLYVRLMDRNKQYIDINKNMHVSTELEHYTDFNGIYPPETFDGHIEIFKNYHHIKSIYSLIETIPREIVNEYTMHKLKVLVELALKNFRFYRDLYGSVGFELGDLKSLKDYAALPTLTKKDLNELYSEASHNPWIKIIHESRTSGSTGEPVSVIKDISAKRYSYAQLMVVFEKMMNDAFNPSSTIYSIYPEPWMHTSILGDIHFFTVDISAPMEEVLKHIYTVKPTVITGFGSNILELANLLNPYPELKLLSTNSEFTSPFQRKQLSNQLGIPILDEYSSEELETIAWERTNGIYTVSEDSVFLELESLDSETGKTVIGTDLLNYTVPKLRYIQGDSAEWVDENPIKGFKKLCSFTGREDMNLVCPVNGVVSSSIILDLIDRYLVPLETNIERFLIVQENISHVVLFISTKDGCVENEYYIEKFKNNFYMYFASSVKLSIKRTNNFPKMGKKRRMLVRNFDV